MPCWFEGPLAAFGTHTTGTDAEQDRVISAALVVQSSSETLPRSTRWLVSPGISVPEAALTGSGLTETHLQMNGRWPAPVMEEVSRALVAQCLSGTPLVMVNAPVALTLFDRELRRHRARSLADCLGRASLCVLDPAVLDTHLDRRRGKGRHTLADLCAHYGVAQADTRDAAADATAALAVVRAVGRRFAARLETLSPAELHTRQAVWYAAQARGLQAWFAHNGSAEAVDPAWPLRPQLSAAA
jgi:DNA polymerase-3 subunit epsilon